MANIFKRISDVLTANLNDLVDRVEDPERMIKQLIREMEENINSAREGVIDALASEKQLAKELDSQRRQADDWYNRARRALETGNETLAREALTAQEGTRRHRRQPASVLGIFPAHQRTAQGAVAGAGNQAGGGAVEEEQPGGAAAGRPGARADG